MFLLYRGKVVAVVTEVSVCSFVGLAMSIGVVAVSDVFVLAF